MSLDFRKIAIVVMLVAGVSLSLSGLAGEPEASPLPAPEQAKKVGPTEGKASEEKKITYDIPADELTLEDKKGNGLYVVCSFSSVSPFRGGFINGSYQSSGWGTLAEKIGGACRGCLESRSGQCRFAGCTATEYYTNLRGERVYPDKALTLNVLLDKSIDTSCEPGQRVVRVVEGSHVALVPLEQVAKVEGRAVQSPKAREEVKQDRNGYTHSYGYSQSWESDSSGFARGSRSAYDSDRDYQFHEEWYRPPFPYSRGPRMAPPSGRERGRKDVPPKNDVRPEGQGEVERREEGGSRKAF